VKSGSKIALHRPGAEPLRNRGKRSPPKTSAKMLTLVAMVLGFAVVQLDVTVVNVAVEQIGASLGGGVTGLQWVVGAYTLTFAALIMTAGAIGDRIGAKRVFIAGFVIFTIASAACGLAPNLGTLIVARAIQGIGAAVLVPCSLALLNHAYREPNKRAKAVGLWAAGASAALAAGPLIGGLLIAGLGWRAIFFINLPIGLVGIWLTWRYVTETPTVKGRGFDVPGQIAVIVSLVAIAGAMILGGKIGWASPWVLGGFAAFLVAGVAFVGIETRSKNPMLPLSLFENATFSATTSIGLLVNTAFYGLIFVLSLLFQQEQGYSALTTGLAFFPMAGAILTANLGAGRLAAWMGPGLLILLGEVLLAGGCVGLLWVDRQTPYWALSMQLVAMGAGVGFLVPPMTSSLLGSVDRSRSGVASGALNSMRQAGSVIGVSLFGSLIGRDGKFIAGMHEALLISTAVVVVGCFLSFLVARPGGAERRH
jgi:DHA2 family methylenomycin A resistance protein-like MFS transporter